LQRQRRAALQTAPRKAGTVNRRRWLRPGLAGLLVLMWLLAGQGRAETGRYAPHSRIQRPHGQGVTLVTAAAALGQLNDGDGAHPGYSFSVVFRPHRAADFQNALYAWNTALVLQVDKQGGAEAAILSADVLLRRYLGDMRPRDARRAAFVGLGGGLSHVKYGAEEGAPAGSADNFSFLAEVGLEWNLVSSLVLLGKGQYRLYDRGGHDHSGWSVHLGAGLPFTL
jgi:hypothetical protein